MSEFFANHEFLIMLFLFSAIAKNVLDVVDTFKWWAEHKQ